jgi:hypothetical protein
MQRMEGLQTLARQHGMRFIPCSTVDDPMAVLQENLRQRAPTMKIAV